MRLQIEMVEQSTRLYLLKWWMTAFASVLPLQKASRNA